MVDLTTNGNEKGTEHMQQRELGTEWLNLERQW